MSLSLCFRCIMLYFYGMLIVNKIEELKKALDYSLRIYLLMSMSFVLMQMGLRF
jgi:hypothetical protein